MEPTGIIALVNCDKYIVDAVHDCMPGQVELMQFENGIELNLEWQKHALNIVAVISEGEILSSAGIALKEALVKKKRPEVPFILICTTTTETLLSLALKAG